MTKAKARHFFLFYSAAETLIHLLLSCKISEDIYANSLGINRRVSEGRCLLLFLYCVDTFSVTRSRFATAGKQESSVWRHIKDFDTNKIVRQMLTETQNWLKRNYCNWLCYAENCLNVSQGHFV